MGLSVETKFVIFPTKWESTSSTSFGLLSIKSGIIKMLREVGHGYIERSHYFGDIVHKIRDIGNASGGGCTETKT